MIKDLIRSALRKSGWELRRFGVVPRTTMTASLQWLASRNLNIQTILDVGASDGRWSQHCMQFFPAAKYVIFEPQPVHSQALDAFANTSGGKVQVVKKAVGAAEGHTFFDISVPMGGALLKDGNGASALKVEMTTVDTATAELHTAGPYLLKLDTHGFERSILGGSQSTLANSAALIIEAYNYNVTDEAFLFWELCAYLAERGFRPIDLVDVGHRVRDQSLWQMDLVFIRSTWEGFKYIHYQ